MSGMSPITGPMTRMAPIRPSRRRSSVATRNQRWIDFLRSTAEFWHRTGSGCLNHRTEVAFNEAHNGRPETGPAFFTYILGFMLEGRPVAYTREFRSSGGDVEIGARKDLPEGEVIFMGQPDIVDHLSSVSIPDGVGDLERPS